MRMNIPKSLKEEHAELHAELVAATKAGGAIGEAARAVAQAVYPHFVREEEHAMPLLGLLTTLVDGKLPADVPAVIAKADKLKEELNHMLHEHKAIVAALQRLAEAARNEKKSEYLRFTEKLQAHALAEEEVMYPAAVMIGEYLKLKVGRGVV